MNKPGFCFDFSLNSYRYVFLFFCISFVGAAIESASYFLLPYLVGIGVNVEHWGGFIMGICYGVSFFVRPLAPYFEHKAGLDRMLWCGYFCYIASTFGLAIFAGSTINVILWRGLTGLGFSMVGVSLLGYQTRFIPENIRGRSLALITTAYSLPSLILVPVLEYLIKNHRFMTYIYFPPILAAIGIAAVIKLPPITNEKDQLGKKILKTAIKRASYKGLIKRPNAVAFVFLVALFAFTDAGQLTFVLLADELDIPASYFFSVSAIVALVLRVTCGRLLDILPRKIYVAGSTAFTAAAILMITCAQNAAQLMIYGAIYGIGMGIGFPSLMCMMLDVGGETYVTRLAVIFGLLYSGIFFVVPIIMDFLFSALGSPVLAYRLIYTIILSTIALLIAISVRENKRKYNKIQE